MFDELTALSPIDDRYHAKTASLAPFFSEYALMKYRVKVEVEYFIWLCSLPLSALATAPAETVEGLRSLYLNFSEDDARHIKEIESVTNHDVKAIEYFIKEKLPPSLEPYKEFIHFGLTSQDINNTSFPLMISDALKNSYLPLLERLIEEVERLAKEWEDVPMLAHTHGQPASPTWLGREFAVYAYRLQQQLKQLKQVPVTAKFGGATGGMNAHKVAYPSLNWPKLMNEFVSQRLGLQREELTTQISNYDNLSALLDAMKRINVVLIDMDRDVWQYISMGYFKQRIKAGEIGSSAMPHKVNPIDFENSEGNLGMANAVLEHLSHKLPVSRLQRDLTDSTVLRNVGVPFAHAVTAMESTMKGLGKLLLNQEAINKDLEQNWAVVAEAIQTILRREGYPKPYETLKQLTRTNENVTHQSIADFVDTLNVSEEVRNELKQITPSNYCGYKNTKEQ